jgi:hypothetical protein
MSMMTVSKFSKYTFDAVRFFSGMVSGVTVGLVAQRYLRGYRQRSIQCALQPRRRAMISKWKLVTILTVATIGVASPAFAQSYDPDQGTGNLVELTYQGAGSHKQTAIRQNGIDAFAMVPSAQMRDVSSLPEHTGGGSLGYNQELEVQP